MPSTEHRLGFDLMIVGSAKSGSSSLFHYLAEHESVEAPSRPEFAYFINEDEFRKGARAADAKYFPKPRAPGSVRMAKLAGLMYFTRAVDRLLEDSPDVRMAVVLRNPVDRAYSAFWFARRRGFEPLASFEEALAADPNRVVVHRGDRPELREYLERGHYVDYLTPLFERAGRERVHVSLLEDLAKRPEAIVNELLAPWHLTPVPEGFYAGKRYNEAANFRSLKVAQLMGSDNFLKRSARALVPPNVRIRAANLLFKANEVPAQSPPLDPEVRAKLTEHYAPYNDRLGQLLGRDLSAWNNPVKPAKS